MTILAYFVAVMFGLAWDGGPSPKLGHGQKMMLECIHKTATF